MHVFQSLHEVREQTEKWIEEYNELPHGSLGHLTPGEYLLTKNQTRLVNRGSNYGTVASATQNFKYVSSVSYRSIQLHQKRFGIQ